MIKFTDLVFSAQDCCGVHTTAHVERSDGVAFGVVATEDEGVYNLTVYKGGGLHSRSNGLTQEKVETAVNAAY